MILILDFGSQYTQLIARRVRELNVYCEILPCRASIEEIRAKKPSGLILSGGPSSIANGNNAPQCDPEVFTLGVPVLGICYGLQIMSQMLGGKVRKASRREFGLAKLELEGSLGLFDGLEPNQTVWMSHGDEVEKPPHGFSRLGKTDNAEYAAIGNPHKKLYGVQFHPEVSHTPKGKVMLKNFLLGICEEAPSWTMPSFIQQQTQKIRGRVGRKRVLCALSGGVDSSVTAALMNLAVGKQLLCVFVDTGLLRHGDVERISRVFEKKLEEQLVLVNARARFLKKLSGVTDPEQKRRLIGREFIAIFEEEASQRGGEYLAQGTLYPDVIESVSVKGPSATIKTHHNVGGLPETMKLKLIEPLRLLFKDEVRLLGKELGLPNEILNHHPFPGPGLAIRILGEVTEERLEILRNAEKIVEEEIRQANLYEKLWQAFAVLLPVKTVGVMGDERTYENVVALRAVESLDGMTADWAKLPPEVLASISNRIINEVKGVNRVVYDVSSKPPATIEWE